MKFITKAINSEGIVSLVKNTFHNLAGQGLEDNVHQHSMAGDPQGLLPERSDLRGDADRRGVSPVRCRHCRHHVHNGQVAVV